MAALIRLAFNAAPKALGVAVILASLITSINLIRRLFSRAALPSDLPWAGAGENNTYIGRAKANLISFFRLNELLDEGYVKYSKNNKAYVLPYFLNGPQVVLPPSQIQWLLSQPDDVLSQEAVNRQFLQAEHAFFDANKVPDPVHPDVIQHQLTKKLGGFIDEIVDEMRASLEDCWGHNTEEWREVRVYDTMLRVVARLSVRVLMGFPLCRDEAFLSICADFIRKVAVAAAGISLFPDFLKPVVGPIFTLFDYILYRRCCGYLMPIIHERLNQLRDPSPDKLPANDFIQWSMDHALAKPTINPVELDARVLAARFAVLAFAAIQSSVITLTNALFDIAASKDCAGILDSMRAEVVDATTTATSTNINIDTDTDTDTITTATTTGVAGSTDKRNPLGTWSKASLARMRRVDSALRESLRLHGFVERGVVKMVVAPAGVALPDPGLLLSPPSPSPHPVESKSSCSNGSGSGGRTVVIPYGTKIGVSGYSIHRDEMNYADATGYEAFRFVKDEEGERKEKGPRGLVNTSEKFLGFSHGSHACPGRFFAANQLKIALGHIALLYDIEPIPERPVNRWFFGHIAPPLTETLRVRRRRRI